MKNGIATALVPRILDRSDNKLEAPGTSKNWIANRRVDTPHGTKLHEHFRPLKASVLRERPSVKAHTSRRRENLKSYCSHMFTRFKSFTTTALTTIIHNVVRAFTKPIPR